MLKYSDEEVSALVKKVKRGNTDAFEMLVEIYQKLVFSTVMADLKNREDAEDVAQEVFLKIWKGIGSFRQDSTFGTWVYTITKNTTRDFISKKKADCPTVDDADGVLPFIHSEEMTPEEEAVDRDSVNEIKKIINSLPEEQRDAITYRDLCGITYLEIADITGVTVGTVKSRISRARETVKKFLEEKNPKVK